MGRLAHGCCALRVRDGRAARWNLVAVRDLARDRPRPLRLLRVPPQSPACPDGPQTVKLHTKILLGLGLGAVLGTVANIAALQRPAVQPAVQWIAGNVASPIGQIFLRLLLMTVIPLV